MVGREGGDQLPGVVEDKVGNRGVPLQGMRSLRLSRGLPQEACGRRPIVGGVRVDSVECVCVVHGRWCCGPGLNNATDNLERQRS